MSNQYKPIPKALFIESLSAYYFGDVLKFDTTTGKADILVGWRDEDNNNEQGWEFPKDVEPINITNFPCMLPVGNVDHQNGIYLPSKDPSTWQVGNMLPDSLDETFNISVSDIANTGTVTIKNAPLLAFSNTNPCWFPLIMFKLSQDIIDYFKNN